jgi:hypothetical protein
MGRTLFSLMSPFLKDRGLPPTWKSENARHKHWASVQSSAGYQDGTDNGCEAVPGHRGVR